MSVRLLHGDCRAVLKALPSESVHCCVTSPPFYGLRDYGVANQIGLEATPDAYVAEIVEVFREVRRVLRNDGTLWLNLGDGYAAAGGYFANAPSNVNGSKQSTNRGSKNTDRKPPPGLKAKDLIGIPWMVAFALRADGWYLRQDMIWSKPNPMPESVRDRCTKAHEYIFLLSKSPRYFYDAEAIAETALQPHGEIKPIIGQKTDAGGFTTNGRGNSTLGSNQGFATRNKRSVWEVATQSFSDAHFATFPPALIEPCILAGCPAKACEKCGKPWVREVERSSSYDHVTSAAGKSKDGPYAKQTGNGAGTHDIRHGVLTQSKTLGFSPSCSCNAATVAGTVLDPFSGAGTTGLVADRLARNAILIELNAGYADMSKRRIVDDAPLFAEVVAA